MEKSSGHSLAVYLSAQRSWYRSKRFPADKITEIYIAQTPDNPDEQWAADALETGAIACLRCGSTLYLTGSHIILPPDCSHLFAGMSSLKIIHGLDNLDASCVSDLSYAFHENHALEHLDMGDWKLDQVTFTDHMFSDCHKLTRIHFGTGLRVIGERMFFRCLALESVSGLAQVTQIGDRAFVYTPVLQHTDLNAQNIKVIGEAACRLSSIEDNTDLTAISLDAIQFCGTRAKRWHSLSKLSQTHPDTPSFIPIPNADCQKNYHGTYGHDASGKTYTIANGACRSFALYHICNAYRFQNNKPTYPSWEAWWNNVIENQYAGAGTFAYNSNDMDSARVLHYLLSASGLSLQRSIPVDADQKAAIIDRLAAGQPIYCSMKSADTNQHHAVVLHGYDPKTDRFALCDSSVCTPIGVTSWFQFEDIFSESDTASDTRQRDRYMLIQPASKRTFRQFLRKCIRKLRSLLQMHRPGR